MRRILNFLIILFILESTAFSQWFKGNGLYYGSSFRSLASSQPYVYVGTFSEGVYRSTNNGLHWEQSGLGANYIYSLASNNNIVYAGTYGNGIYVSTNYGTNWVQTLPSRYVRTIATGTSTVYTGTDSYGVYLSTNNGQNWIQTSLNNKSVWALAVNG